jgi:hypothetical protein
MSRAMPDVPIYLPSCEGSADDTAPGSFSHGPQKIHKILAARDGGESDPPARSRSTALWPSRDALATGDDPVQAPVTVRDSDRLPRIIVYHKPEGEIVGTTIRRAASVFGKLPPMRRAVAAVSRLDYNTSVCSSSPRPGSCAAAHAPALRG